VYCWPTECIESVIGRFSIYSVEMMPVCIFDRKLIGVVSEQDLVSAFAEYGEDFGILTARDLMKPAGVTCRHNQLMVEAARTMRANGMRRLVAVNAGRAIGVVSIHDILACRNASIVAGPQAGQCSSGAPTGNRGHLRPIGAGAFK